MGAMASMACRTFSSLDCTCSLEQASSKRPLWPLWHVARPSSPSKHFEKPHRRTLLACSARETLVSQSPSPTLPKTAEDSLAANLEPELLAPRSPDPADGGLPAEEILRNSQPPTLQRDGFSTDLQGGGLQLQLQTSQETTQVGFATDTQADLLLKDQEEEEEFLKGFPGAKGAIVKPLSSDVIAHFPEGFLSNVTAIERLEWVTLVPNGMLPKGDRLVLSHNKESVMLFWFKGKIFALENRSPAAPMFEEGFAKAVITEEGLIVCPITQSKFDIRTGDVIEWLPNSSWVSRLISPAYSDLTVYDVKASPDLIFINRYPLLVGGYYPLAEFTGNRISTDPNYEKPIIFDDLEFGFTEENELTNGRAAMLAFLSLILIETTTGDGILKGSGILDFLYTNFLPGFPILRY